MPPWALQSPASWLRALEFSWPKHNLSTLARRGIQLLKVSQAGDSHLWQDEDFLPWWSPFFWYMLLGRVSLLHSDGLSILSCWDGVSCSLYSQKYLLLPLFREDIAVISFKSSTESFSYPKMDAGVYLHAGDRVGCSPLAADWGVKLRAKPQTAQTDLFCII